MQDWACTCLCFYHPPAALGSTLWGFPAGRSQTPRPGDRTSEPRRVPAWQRRAMTPSECYAGWHLQTITTPSPPPHRENVIQRTGPWPFLFFFSAQIMRPRDKHLHREETGGEAPWGSALFYTVELIRCHSFAKHLCYSLAHVPHNAWHTPCAGSCWAIRSAGPEASQFPPLTATPFIKIISNCCIPAELQSGGEIHTPLPQLFPCCGCVNWWQTCGSP